MLSKLRPDTFTLLLLSCVLLATFLPCEGEVAVAFGWATKIAITLLFFMHGAKLTREAILGGISAWKLHIAVTLSTFVLFPVFGLLITAIPEWMIPSGIKQGFLFLSVLPSTVQSSIAFTSIAGGNVAAAVCSASLSNIVGVFVTPLLAGLMISGAGAAHGGTLDAIISVATTLLLPFMVGHFSRPLTGRFVDKHKALLGKLDRGSILLVVYTAFSAAVIEGLWTQVSIIDLVTMLVINIVLLLVVLFITWRTGRAMFARPEEIVLVFCGSKKSLASGVPMAAALFAPAQVGIMILPLMLFHQVQLIVCAFIARAYAEHGREGVGLNSNPAAEQA